MSLAPIPEGPLRSGYTTGACATACTKAALLSLVYQMQIEEVTIVLPLGESVGFKIVYCLFNLDYAVCSTIKDAGDDPDVTHGAEISCKVAWKKQPGVLFLRGEGVGIVTLPGLSIPVGEPAINPVPRQMISAAVNKILFDCSITKGVTVEVSVKNGKELAKKTLNSRLGIVDGLSILGTTGIVRPFSAAAYIASITQGIDVAVANGCEEIVINSGGRTEQLLKEINLHLPGFAFVQYGNWIGETLEKMSTTSLQRVTMGIMLGKAVKLAKGEIDTHSGKSSWDKDFIVGIARESGYEEALCLQILELNMARRLTEIFSFSETEPFYQQLCKKCYEVCSKKIPGIGLCLILFSTDNRYIRYKEGD